MNLTDSKKLFKRLPFPGLLRFPAAVGTKLFVEGRRGCRTLPIGAITLFTRGTKARAGIIQALALPASLGRPDSSLKSLVAFLAGQFLDSGFGLRNLGGDNSASLNLDMAVPEPDSLPRLG